MKRLIPLLSAAAFATGLDSQATAADLPVKAPPMVAATVYNWTGFYIGAHIGAGWGTSDTTFVDNTSAAFPAGTALNSLKTRGVLGGGQIGYNFQSQNFVFG